MRGTAAGWGVVALAAVALAGGCAPAAQKAPPRQITQDVQGALGPERLRELYATPAFVVRDVRDGRRAAVQDTGLAADAEIDDSNLLVFVEGAGDAVPGFRWTAGLLAESPHGFPSDPDRLLIVVVHWSQSALAVAEHLNRPAQLKGAAVLNHMLEVHRRRHPGTAAGRVVAGGAGGHVSLIAFSAGTRVTELAFRGEVAEGESTYPDALACVEDIVFLGSSMWCRDGTPFEMIRGRFLNFINVRDTHFGDRAAYAAPAGKSPRVVEWLEQGMLVRRPHYGASVTGFVDLPTLTSVAQFDAIDAALRAGAAPLRDAFRRVNVPVPRSLVAYSLFGDAAPDDDFDDYLNLAPNHYILVGRGAGGSIDVPSFKQYRASAQEFVQEFVAAAALRGRLDRFDLKTLPQGANPLRVPLPVPWAIFGSGQKTPAPEEPKEPPESEPQAKPDPTPPGGPPDKPPDKP